jgi:hypothetical protein
MACPYKVGELKMSKEINFRLAKQEAISLRQHISQIIRLDRQVADSQRDLAAECNALETAWQNAYRRNLLEMVEQGRKIVKEDLCIPPAIEDGEIKIVITNEYSVRVVRNG